MECRGVLAGIASAALLAGCAGAPVDPSGGGGPGSGRTSGSTPAPSPSAEPMTVNCDDVVYEPGELAHTPSASSLPAGPTGAIIHGTDSPAFDPSRNWKVVHQSDGRVELIRELDEPHGADTHEFRILNQSTGSSNTAAGSWLLTAGGRCAQRMVTNDGLDDAELRLAQAPSQGDKSIELLVDHRTACGPRGQSPAKARIELLELTETAHQVQVRIGVRPFPERGGICPPRPLTSFTVELNQPLGDREIVDAALVPPRSVPAP